jgi:hypothetical protein
MGIPQFDQMCLPRLKPRIVDDVVRRAKARRFHLKKLVRHDLSHALIRIARSSEFFSPPRRVSRALTLTMPSGDFLPNPWKHTMENRALYCGSSTAPFAEF